MVEIEPFGAVESGFFVTTGIIPFQSDRYMKLCLMHVPVR